MAVGATLVVALPGPQAFTHGERGPGGEAPPAATPARPFALGAAPGATPLPVPPSAPPLGHWWSA